MLSVGGGTPTFSRCAFALNRGGMDGAAAGGVPPFGSAAFAGACGVEGAVAMMRCVIRGNIGGDGGVGPGPTGAGAADDGGAGAFRTSAPARNVLVVGNTGGLPHRAGVGTTTQALEFATITGNTSAGGTAALTASAAASRRSSIVRGNSAAVDLAGPAAVSFSDVAGGAAGLGNIDADPLFADAAAGDYRLRSGSPCVNAGATPSPGAGPSTWTAGGASSMPARTSAPTRID